MIWNLGLDDKRTFINNITLYIDVPSLYAVLALTACSYRVRGGVK